MAEPAPRLSSRLRRVLRPEPIPDDRPLDPTTADALVNMIEERRSSTLGLIYQTPGLSLTAQAFLFTITLDPTTTATGRVIGALVGVIAGGVTAVAIVKHNYTEEMYASVLDRCLTAIGRPQMHRHELAALAWNNPEMSPDLRRWRTRRWRVVARKARATDLWIYSLLLFALVDLAVLVLSLVQVFGGPHPLS